MRFDLLLVWCSSLTKTFSEFWYPTINLNHFVQILGIVEDPQGFGAGAVLATAWTVGDWSGYG